MLHIHNSRTYASIERVGQLLDIINFQIILPVKVLGNCDLIAVLGCSKLLRKSENLT